jgi:hypothetical protein
MLVEALMRAVILVVVASLTFAADKGPPRGEAANKAVKVEATAWIEKAEIDKAVGAAMEPNVAVLDVKITPLDGKPFKVWLDDFLLRSDKDGSRATPYQPSQIAGSSVLVVSDRYNGGGIASEDRGPAWGGIGGRPQRLPGQSPGIGNAGGTSEAVTSVRDDETPATRDESPLLRALKAKILAEKEITEPQSGQLYFLLEGKHKPKQIELIVKTPAGPLSLRFKQ